MWKKYLEVQWFHICIGLWYSSGKNVHVFRERKEKDKLRRHSRKTYGDRVDGIASRFNCSTVQLLSSRFILQMKSKDRQVYWLPQVTKWIDEKAGSLFCLSLITTPVELCWSVTQWMDGEWTVHYETKVAGFLLDSCNSV